MSVASVETAFQGGGVTDKVDEEEDKVADMSKPIGFRIDKDNIQ